MANGYFRVHLGRELPPITLYVYADLESIAAAYSAAEGFSLETARAYWSSGATATAQLRRMFVNTGSPSWRPAQAPEGIKLKIVAHEAFHLLQSEWVRGYPGASNTGPMWLLEGTAEYIAFRAIADNGLVSFNDARAGWRISARTVQAPLRSLETYAGFLPESVPYHLSPLAAERLLGTTLGLPAFVSFYEAIGAGAAWRDAFLNTFGRTVDAFYDDYEAYRRGP
jgi:hypothetical protein